MLGKRRIDLLDHEFYLLRPGEFMHSMGDSEHMRTWYVRTPINASFPKGAIADLWAHEIVEHEDRTITVAPSILVTGGGQWHGYLVKGVWTEV